MRLQILYFAVVRERLKLDGESIDLDAGSTVTQLLERLVRRHPALASLAPALKVAVNQDLASGDRRLADGDEIALIPPVSGGAPLARVTDEPLELAEVVSAVSVEEHGGVATFSGVVRSHSRGKRVVRLEYEAYRPMAERAMASIIDAIAREMPGVRLAIVHRVGVLAVGDLAVVLAASAPHRAAAFSACQTAIDRLKQSVPIWKKEITDDGESWIGLGP